MMSMHGGNAKPPSKPMVLDHYTVKCKPMDGSFTKACIKICLGLNDQVASATIASQVYNDVLANKDTYSLNNQVKLIGKHPSLFLFLVVISPYNQVVVLQVICLLDAPFHFSTNMMEISWYSAMIQEKPRNS